MAIDYGDAHTGIAVSDRTATLCGFTAVIDTWRQERLLAEIVRLAAEHEVSEFVLGYPKNMDGSIGERAEKAEALAALLRQETGLPVTLWDERRTTVDAHRILAENGRDGRARKKTVDAVAASLMLEGFLRRRSLMGSTSL